MSDQIKAVLFADSSPADNITDIQGSPGGYTRTTVAGLKDYLASTASRAHCAGDNVVIGIIEWREEWVLQTLADVGVISKVRVTVRAKCDAAVLTANTTIQPSIGGTARGTAAAFQTSEFDHVFEFATDPADGQPWTLAKVNGYAWGWFAHIETVLATDAGDVYAQEFRLDVIGPVGPAAEVIVIRGSAAPIVIHGRSRQVV